MCFNTFQPFGDIQNFNVYVFALAQGLGFFRESEKANFNQTAIGAKMTSKCLMLKLKHKSNIVTSNQGMLSTLNVTK